MMTEEKKVSSIEIKPSAENIKVEGSPMSEKARRDARRAQRLKKLMPVVKAMRGKSSESTKTASSSDDNQQFSDMQIAMQNVANAFKPR